MIRDFEIRQVEEGKEWRFKSHFSATQYGWPCWVTTRNSRDRRPCAQIRLRNTLRYLRLGTAQIIYSNLQIMNGRVIYNNERFIILIFTCQGFESAFMRDLRAYLAGRMW
jgi:hypothetical protein